MTGNLEDVKSRRMWTAVLAEGLGTMLLVLVGCGACYGGNVVQISLSYGFTVATIVWAIGHVSGGHINPAVTIGFMAARRITVVRGLFYIIAQVVGAIAGAGILKGLSPDGTSQGTVVLGTGVSVAQGVIIEFILGFILVFVVFSCVDGLREDIGGSVPLTVGLAIMICHLWAVDRTGAGMNPARSLGSAIVNNAWASSHWIYHVGPLLGGIMAALLYDFFFAVNANPIKARGYFTRKYDNCNYDRFGRKPETNADHSEHKESSSVQHFSNTGIDEIN